MSAIAEHARNLIGRIKSDNNQFGTSLLFDNGNGATASVSGFVIKHSLGFDLNTGNMQNAATRRVSLSETVLTNEGYPTRNPVTKNIQMEKHKVTYTDISGVTGTYIITLCTPGETVGELLITLGETSIPKS